MSGQLIPERLIAARKSLGINKAKAASLLGLSKMGYGRYEHGDRTPSAQTVEYIAWKFNTSTEYLTGETDDPSPEWIHVSRKDTPELFDLVKNIRNSELMQGRLLTYYDSLVKR